MSSNLPTIEQALHIAGGGGTVGHTRLKVTGKFVVSPRSKKFPANFGLTWTQNHGKLIFLLMKVIALQVNA